MRIPEATGRWLALAGVLLAAAPGAGQSAGGWLTGRLTDAGTGAPVIGAEVRAEGAVSVRTVSDRDGAWRLGPLVDGSYRLAVEHLGYAGLERRVEVGAGPLRVELALTPRPVALDAMVVTASRRLQRLAETPVATELVTRREVQETGASDLAAVLTERAGIALEGGHPAGSGLMIQGLGAERVLVLVDGQPFIGRLSGMVDVSRIPAAMVERVEIVRGPQSTLYGSDAMGGVVNVVTRTPSRSWTVGGVVTAGDQGRLDVSANARGGAGGWTGVADLGRRAVELTPGQAGESGSLSTRWDAFTRLRWAPAAGGWQLEGSGMLLDERQRWRSGQLYQFADNVQWSGRLGASWDAGPHAVSGTGYLTRFDHLMRRSSTDRPVAGTGTEETQRLARAELLYAFQAERGTLDLGVEAERESIRSDRVLGAGQDDATLEGYVQGTLGGERLTVVPGVRATWSRLWGTHFTPRLATALRLSDPLTLRLSYGTGFRAPAFKELFMEFMNIGPGFGYAVRGNPDLGPERSRNLTANLELAGDRTYLRLHGFDNRFDGFIETRALPDSAGVQFFTYGNVEDGFTRGVEVEAGLNWRGWRLEAGHQWLAAEDGATGRPLLGRPGTSGRATLGYVRPSGLRLSLTGVRTGRTAMRHLDDGTAWREPFLRLDLRAAHAIPGGLELVLGVDNLLDEQPAEWPGFTGRHLYTGLSWQAAAAGQTEPTGGR